MWNEAERNAEGHGLRGDVHSGPWKLRTSSGSVSLLFRCCGLSSGCGSRSVLAVSCHRLLLRLRLPLLVWWHAVPDDALPWRPAYRDVEELRLALSVLARSGRAGGGGSAREEVGHGRRG